jgi:endonuclease/exonuclease/phosphatase family metal-dependent hydrolase
LLGAYALPFAAISLVTGNLSMIFRAAGHYCTKSDFEHLQGTAEKKPAPDDGAFTAFAENICFIGGGYPLRKGGVLPWKQRIDELVRRIEENDSDVICLNEVYDANSAYKLYNKLKHRYAHFYINIGSHYFGSKSGLFVASKYRVLDPNYVPFDPATLVHYKLINKGFFSFKIANSESVPFGKIYTSHLQHSEDDTDPSAEEMHGRRLQLDALFADMQRDRDKSYPTLLTGDLNIGGKEFEDSILSHHFEKATSRSPIRGTCRRDLAISRLWGKEAPADLTEEVDIDHTLVLKPKKADVSVTYVPAYRLDEHPLLALSDHHGQMISVKC